MHTKKLHQFTFQQTRITKAGYKLTPRMTSPFPTRNIKALPSLLLFFLVPAKAQYNAQYKMSVQQTKYSKQSWFDQKHKPIKYSQILLYRHHHHTDTNVDSRFN